MGYKLYAKARKQLMQIWTYSYKNWGEKQADDYLEGLYKRFENLQTDKHLWRHLNHPCFEDVSVFYCRHEKHFIFFKELSSGTVGIISILHERMNLPDHLYQDVLKH